VPDNIGWVFSAWSGDATGSDDPLTVIINGNKSITATFIDSGVGQFLYLPVILKP
jgi:uncharacterized repeat protein (TIGR02543 family)